VHHGHPLPVARRPVTLGVELPVLLSQSARMVRRPDAALGMSRRGLKRYLQWKRMSDVVNSGHLLVRLSSRIGR
jgi:hypothetical protein